MTSEATLAFHGRTPSANVHSLVRYRELIGGEPSRPHETDSYSGFADGSASLAAGELRIQAESPSEAESQREYDRDEHRELFTLAPDAMLVTDLAAVVRTANAAGTRMFEAIGRRLRGRALAECVAPHDRLRFWDAVALAGRGPVVVKLWLHDRREGPVLVCLRGAPVHHGRRILWSVSPAAPPVMDDERVAELTQTLHERNDQLAQALARCERLELQGRSRDASLALLAHELRGPTDVIIGWSRLLRGGAASEHERARAMATIERNAVAQSVLVDDLVEASGFATNKLSIRLERTDVGELTRIAVEDVRAAADERGVALTCEVQPGLTVLGDRARLAQVMSNLLSNAVKFTPSGGNIDVRCFLHGGSAARHSVVVEVTDSGIGIHPGDPPRLFEYRRHCHAASRRSPGLGLGLFLVRELVEMHGGRASVRSAGPGKGATFVVSLPTHAG